MIRPLAIPLLLVGCAASLPPPPPELLTPPPLVRGHIVVAEGMTPAMVVIAAIDAEADSSAYVERPGADPAIVDQLITLNVRLENAVNTMREHPTTANVLAARDALAKLREYLTKSVPKG